MPLRQADYEEREHFLQSNKTYLKLRKNGSKADLKEFMSTRKETLKSLYKEFKKSEFHVYCHFNSKGAMYIGSGDKYRPYRFNHSERTQPWLNVFGNEEPMVKIIETFKTKEQAIQGEQDLINVIGLHNLVNQQNAIRNPEVGEVLFQNQIKSINQ